MIVIPEVDLPGHTHAIGVAYPELVEAPVLNDALMTQSEQLGQPLPVAGEPYLGWGVGHSSVRIHEEETYRFVRDVVRELAEMTPGPYIHIGGDESSARPRPTSTSSRSARRRSSSRRARPRWPGTRWARLRASPPARSASTGV